MDKKDDLKQALIYQPKLLPFESERAYRLLEDAIRDHISPRDILEEMWTSEIIEGEWEAGRLRRPQEPDCQLGDACSASKSSELDLCGCGRRSA